MRFSGTARLHVLCLAAIAAGLSASAQDIDPEAAEAFQKMVKAQRDAPSLEVQVTLKVSIGEDGAEAAGDEVKATFIHRRGGAGQIQLGGYTIYINDGVCLGIHESNDDAFFRMEYDEDAYPYWEIWSAFGHAERIPFPYLGLFWGSDVMEDLYMELFADTPEMVPTAFVSREIEGKSVQTIELSGGGSVMKFNIDPKTTLIHSIEHLVTSGPMIPDGATQRKSYEIDYTLHDAPLDDSSFALVIGDRQKTDLLAALDKTQPEQPPAPPGGGPGPGEMVGQPAPTFILTTMDGAKVNLNELRGQVVVIDFWATWCGPCIQALPELHKVAAWAKENDLPVTFLAVNTFEGATLAQDTPDARLEVAKKLWRQSGYSIPVIMDFTDDVAGSYGVTGIPATFVIDGKGTVHAQHSGFGPGYAESLKKEIAEAAGAM